MKGSGLVDFLQITGKVNVYFELEKQIINGTLKQNEKLSEQNLLKQFKCEDSEIREAFQKLEERGLIKLIPFSGAFVTDFSYEEIKELFEYRCLIELNALNPFILYSTHRDLAVLSETIEVMIEAAKKEDFEKLLLYDMYFHRYITKKSKRILSLNLWSRIEPHIKRFLSHVHPRVFTDYREIAESHIPLLEALKRGNAEQARELFKKHVAIEHLIEKLPSL